MIESFFLPSSIEVYEKTFKIKNKAKKNKVIFEILDAIVNINSISDPVVAIWKKDQIISLLEFFVRYFIWDLESTVDIGY